MDHRTRRIVAIALVWGSVFAWPWEPSAATESPLSATLYVYNYAELTGDDRTQAARIVTAIYAAAGIGTHWVDVCPRADCRGSQLAVVPALNGPLTVIIAGDEMTPREPRSNVMGVAQPSGTVAYVYLSRIRHFAFRRDLSLSAVLGHVIAHEVGHILLQEGHAIKGIMRARWDRDDLLDLRQGRLLFTAAQRIKIRTRLAACG